MITKRENIILTSSSPEQTIEIGKALAALLENGDLVSLTGPLGAGKTCLIKGIAGGFGIEEDEITSPSYTLVNEYFGRLPIYHFDLYRMKESSELYGIGWDEYLMRDGILVVEWGERADEQMPDERIEIIIEILSENKRKIKIDF